MIDTIIFDVDGVIAKSEELWNKSQREFLSRWGIHYNPEIKKLLTGKSLLEGVTIMKQFYGIDGDPKELEKERRRIIMPILEDGLSYIDGFLDFHNKVKSKFKICVGTSLDSELLSIYDRKLKLSELFSNNVFCISHVNMVSKPNPDIFLYAAKCMDSKPECCLVIEDSPNGVESAKRAGMKCIALTTTFEKNLLGSADYIVNSYREILSTGFRFDVGDSEKKGYNWA